MNSPVHMHDYVSACVSTFIEMLRWKESDNCAWGQHFCSLPCVYHRLAKEGPLWIIHPPPPQFCLGGGSREGSGGSGGSDKPPWAPRTTHCMCLSGLVKQWFLASRTPPWRKYWLVESCLKVLSLTLARFEIHRSVAAVNWLWLLANTHENGCGFGIVGVASKFLRALHAHLSK